MNKKTLFLILSFLILPIFVYAQDYDFCSFMANVEAIITNIGGSMVIVGWVVAGILWLISGGSPEKTGLAKKATVAAIIGTVLVILAGIAFPLIQQTLAGRSGTYYRCTGR